MITDASISLQIQKYKEFRNRQESKADTDAHPLICPQVKFFTFQNSCIMQDMWEMKMVGSVHNCLSKVRN